MPKLRKADTIRYSTASFAFEVVDPDGSLARETVPGHVYEPGVTAILRRVLSSADGAFVDIGALYGYFAIYASKLNPDLPVYAFEPQLPFFELLSLNVDRNAVPVRCERLACSDAEGPVEMSHKTMLSGTVTRQAVGGLCRVQKRIAELYYQGGLPSSAGLARRHGFDWTVNSRPRMGRLAWVAAMLDYQLSGGDTQIESAATVPALPFDQWASRNAVEANVAKVDVHGAEGKVLRGMRRALAEDLAYVLVEVHDADLLVDTSHEEIVTLLEQGGFEIYEVKDFRTSLMPALIPLKGAARDDVVDPRRWSWKEKALMRMLCATKSSAVLGDLISREVK